MEVLATSHERLVVALLHTQRLVAEATATVRAQRLVADEFDVLTQAELEDVLQRLLFLQQCVEMILVRFRLGFHLR